MDNQNKYVKSSVWSNIFKTRTEKSEMESLLLSMPPFRELDDKHLKQLLKIIHLRDYAANEYIFHQGDPGIGLYIVQEGEVLISHKNEDNYEHNFVKLGVGDFFGELALLDGEVRSASAISLKESKLLVVFKPDLDEFIEKFPRKGNDILKGIAQIISTRLRKLNEDYVDLYNKSIKNIQEVRNGDT